MRGVQGLIERLAGNRTDAVGGRLPAGLGRPAAQRAVEWLLVAWTAVAALFLLFLQGSLSELAAAGLRDPAGQRLLGAQFAVLAPVYAYCARSVSRGAGWLPIAGQALTAIVIAVDLFAGRRHATTAAPALVIALGFAVLLVAFRLAGQPFYRAEAPAAPPPAEVNVVDQPTERLSALRPDGSPQPAESLDDRLLGI